MESEKFDLRVLGGTLVSAAARTQAHLYVTDGRVALIDRELHAAAHTQRADGLFVLPGMVDTHVHLMDPGDPTREDFPHGTAAAAAAGVTTIVEHTHGHPLTEADHLREKVSHLSGRSYVDFGLAGHVWPDRLGALRGLWQAGATFFKIFTCTTHGVPGVRPERLALVLGTLASFGGACLIHAEDEELLDRAEVRLRAEGRTDPGLLIEWRNRPAEEAAVAAVTELIRQTGVRATIAHVSTPQVVELVRAGRDAGADVAAEACPQYFYLMEDEVRTEGALRKFTPPARLRSTAEQKAMWDLLRSGGFGHVSTDHAPSTKAQKLGADFWEAPFGLPGLDTTLPLLLDASAHGLMHLEDIVRLYAEAPAARYQLTGKGRLSVGADADFVLVDPTVRWVIQKEHLRSKAGWSPYEGRQVTGRAVATFVRGAGVVLDHDLVGEMDGHFLPGPGAAKRRRAPAPAGR